jgi:hypothetical protein
MFFAGEKIQKERKALSIKNSFHLPFIYRYASHAFLVSDYDSHDEPCKELLFMSKFGWNFCFLVSLLEN